MRRLSLWLCDIRLSVFCQPTGTVCHVVGINVVFYLIKKSLRDKLEDIDRDLEAREGYYYTTYGKHIVEEYRKGK